MFNLKNGNLRTVVYNKSDLELYFQAGWSLVEKAVKEDKPKVQKEEKVDEQDSSKSKSRKK